MTDNQIKIADTFIFHLKGSNVLFPSDFRRDCSEEIDPSELRVAIAALLFDKIIREKRKEHPSQTAYQLTEFGILLKNSGKSYSDFLREKQGNADSQKEKEERDEKTKVAQLQKLEAELAVLKDMQNEQRTFWQSGIDRDKRQRWQFWLTLLLGGGGFILGIINFVKDVLLRK